MDELSLKKANKIANKARKSISKFCFEECHAYCCRKGYIILTKYEVNKVTQNRKKELEKLDILKKLENGNYSLNMGKNEYPCPSLQGYKCLVHKSKKRSKTCGDFPIFIEEKYIKLSPRCLAVKENRLYPFISQWMQLGFKIMKDDPPINIK
jgi:hypothetical protein